MKTEKEYTAKEASRFENLYEERVKELRKIKDRLAIFRSLTQHAGWLMYKEALLEQAHERKEILALTVHESSK